MLLQGGSQSPSLQGRPSSHLILEDEAGGSKEASLCKETSCRSTKWLLGQCSRWRQTGKGRLVVGCWGTAAGCGADLCGQSW